LLKELSRNKNLSVAASKQINDALAKFGEMPDAAALGPGFADE